ncbi:MAG: hypothetical protein PHX65_08180 [Sulfurimonas sp.]|nr:hypothetical protein [Sulfurimonas sp.]
MSDINIKELLEAEVDPKLFESDEERLEYLFKMYEEMTAKEKKK